MSTVLVGRKAPDFHASAVLGTGEIVDNLHFSEMAEGHYSIVFFYPLDFTFVCPSELIALNRRLPDFEKLGTKIFAVSIDSQFTHNAWRNTPIDKGGIGEVGFAMVADVNHAIAQSYGVEHPEAGVAFRGAFIIDKQGVVRSQIVNDLPLGRSIDELIRLVEALQFHEENGEVCPANWQRGKKGMIATPEGVASFLAENHEEL